MTSHAATARRTGVLGALGVLWRFSRPHTLVGTVISATGLYLIAVAVLPGSGLDQLFWVIVAGAGVNLAIVGVNQITDIEIDRDQQAAPADRGRRPVARRRPGGSLP